MPVRTGGRDPAAGRLAHPTSAQRVRGEPHGPSAATLHEVQFSAELRERVANGTITVSYRLWSRPKVKVGGVYRSGPVMIEVDDVDLVPFSSITGDDLARTGEPDLEGLRRRAAHAGPITDDTLVYRVEFHVCGDEISGRHPAVG